MSSAIIQNGVYFVILLLLTKPLGIFMYQVFNGERTFLHPVLRPVESGLYRLTGVDETQEMRWNTYAVAMLLFNFVGWVVLYLLQRLQGGLPFNPQRLPGVEQYSSFNTAVSFMTNTNWQGYAGESTMSYMSQMAGLTVQNFVSAATGIAIAIALVRGFARHTTQEIGNFWVDLVRGTVYLLLPLSIVLALALIAQGTPQTLTGATEETGLSGVTRLIPLGPAASQIAIKQLGTNGGGFWNANSAFPFENPTPLTNYIEALSILVISAGLTYTFGKMVGNTRQGWAVFAAMSILFFVGIIVATWAEGEGNPLLTQHGADQSTEIVGLTAPGGNMEGKEVRFGIPLSTQWAVATTDASKGSVNSMHDSYTPLGGLVPLANIALGEVIFGGVGAGLYGFLMYAVTAIFIAGLMVGRTPEYLGKKIEAYDIKMAMLAILAIPLLILVFTGISVVIEPGLSSRLNPAAHGLSEIQYAFTSGAGNNGSAFAGLNANTPWYNTTIGLAMLFGRFFIIIPALALAGNLVAKKRAVETAGTFPTTGPLWVGLLVGVIVIVGALTFFPSFALGAVIEHFQMHAGDTFALGS
jgi:K+-transporting ATPase ATPase A chain